jgi:hypothetical protein
MVALFHRRYPGAELPKRRVELYQEMCILQLRDRPGARRLETLLHECDPQTILQMLALEMMQQKEERGGSGNPAQSVDAVSQRPGGNRCRTRISCPGRTDQRTAGATGTGRI